MSAFALGSIPGLRPGLWRKYQKVLLSRYSATVSDNCCVLMRSQCWFAWLHAAGLYVHPTTLCLGKRMPIFAGRSVVWRDLAQAWAIYDRFARHPAFFHGSITHFIARRWNTNHRVDGIHGYPRCSCQTDSPVRNSISMTTQILGMLGRSEEAQSTPAVVISSLWHLTAAKAAMRGESVFPTRKPEAVVYQHPGQPPMTSHCSVYPGIWYLVAFHGKQESIHIFSSTVSSSKPARLNNFNRPYNRYFFARSQPYSSTSNDQITSTMPSFVTIILASAASLVVARPQDIDLLKSKYGYGPYISATSDSAWSTSTAEAYSSGTAYSSSSWLMSSASARNSSAYKANTTTITSYTNTVYVTQATTATTAVDCGEGTMIYKATAPVPMPYKPSASASWSGSAPWSPPIYYSASNPVATTDCANASITYTYTLKASTSSQPASKPYLPTTGAPMPFPPAPTGGAEDSSSTNASPEQPIASHSSSAPFAGGAASQSVAAMGASVAILSLLAAALM